jgi:5-hydroxyisourate hydrolase
MQSKADKRSDYMGKLTTHVLDTMHGKPAAEVACQVYRIDGDKRELLVSTQTNHDGRVDKPLLEGDALAVGVYEIVFHMGEYFARKGVELPSPRFVDVVVLRFGVNNASEHFHVPLVVTPWTYSTYRGS